MKITRVKLSNYIGLQEGTGLDSMEIDFRPCLDDGIKIFFFFGRNGSGKSTLVSALTPFAENFDGRSVQIIPNHPGSKEIELLAPDGSWYLAEHRWNERGKVSSFLYRHNEPIFDLPEMEREHLVLPETAKGNVTTFRTEIQRCLGITKEYLKIGRIGGRISSLLEMNASERKKFISGFMPILEDWQKMYKNSNHRLTLINNEIRGITTELAALPEEGQLVERRNTLQGEVDYYVKKMLTLVEEHGAHTTRMEGHLDSRNTILANHGISSTDSTTFDLLTPRLEEAQKEEVSAEMRVDDVVTRNPSVKKYRTIDDIAGRLQEIGNIKAGVEAQLDAAKEKVSDLERRSAEANASVSRIEESYRRIKTGQDRCKELLKQKREIETDLAAAQVDLDRTGLESTFKDVPKEELDYSGIKIAGERLRELVNDITQVSVEISTQAAIDLAIETNLDEDALLGKEDRLGRKMNEFQDLLEKKQSRLMSSEKEASFYNRFEGKHCINPSCPFEPEIKSLGISQEDVEKKRKEISAIKEQMAENESRMWTVKSLKSLGNRMRQVYERALPYSRIYLRAGLPNVWKDFKGFLKFALSSEARRSSIQPLCDYAYHVSVVEGGRGKLQQVEKTLEDLSSLSGTGDDLVTEMERTRDIAVREKEALNAARAERDDLEKKKGKCEKGMTIFKTLLEAYETQENARSVVKGIESDSRNLRQIETEYRITLKNIEDNLAIQKTTKEAEDRARQGLSEVERDLSRREDHERRIKEIRGKMTLLKAIVDGCHPAKGAPVHFVKRFLDQMRNDVNDMLDTAFNGEFRLDFILSESEFSMPVLRDSGRVIKDISEASEGQQALAKTVINLVTVQRTLADQSGYNVVSLDEIDGPLDREKNRERFVSIVEEFIESMGLEQLFVISHNDAFHDTKAGLVLLPGHALPINDEEFMKDKTIIYETT